MLVVIGAIFLGLIFILGVSISRFSERVGFYTSQLNSQVVDLEALLERLGLSNVDLRDVIKPSALTGAVGRRGRGKRLIPFFELANSGEHGLLIPL